MHGNKVRITLNDIKREFSGNSISRWFPVFEISENLKYFQYTSSSLTHTQNEMDIQAAAVASTMELELQETQNMAVIRHKSSKLIISLKADAFFYLMYRPLFSDCRDGRYRHVKDKRWVTRTGKMLMQNKGQKIAMIMIAIHSYY